VLYKKKGWDPDSGVPTRQRLDDLDIPWVADLIGAP
jgi:aldehyde:ferredoxin oxidoreductase